MFAKLFETEVGQILVKKDSGDEGAQVTVYFEPENLGVCNMSFNWCEDDEDVQWEKCDKAFDMMTKDKCTDLVKDTLDNLQNIG